MDSLYKQIIVKRFPLQSQLALEELDKNVHYEEEKKPKKNN